MARENQGLQIGLIVFVILTIILGVTTYLFYRQYDEWFATAKAETAKASKNAADARKNGDDANELKRMLGVAATENVDAIKDNLFKEDMKKYGSTYPEETRFYRPLLEKMSKTINQRNVELADEKAKIPKLEDDFKKREAARDLQVKQFRDESTKDAQDLASERAKYKNERDRITQDESKLQSDLQTARKEAAATLAAIESKLLQAGQRIKTLLGTNEEASAKLAKLTTGKMGSPNGEITWVNQREGTVWINIGRADALSRQVNFSVYPAESNETTESKAGIEVTRIVGDHLAEARILGDQISNPIIPGDKIFTPLWSPGERRHYALAGLMDINGDGRSDLDTVVNIIQANGGVVDCYIPDSGKDKNRVKGAITVNTNCLIKGEPPDEKGDPAQLEAFTKIKNAADQYRLQTMKLGEFLQRIGWKNMSPVVRYGHGATANDFRAKPEEGSSLRKSTGNTSDVFKQREPPPAGSPSNSYYRF